jgi:hypothetical protein
MLAGLSLDSEDFAVLPPHFSDTGLNRLTELGLDTFLDGFGEYTPSFRRCLPYFLASLLFHLPTLRLWFPDTAHPLWGCKLFTVHSVEILDELRSHIIVCNFVSPSGMQCTGVPGIIALQRKLSQIGSTINMLEVRLSEQLQARYAEMCSKVDTIPEILERMLMDRFNVEGVIPLNTTDVRAILRECTADIRSDISALRATITSGGATNAQAATVTAAVANDMNTACVGKRYFWGNAYHMVPETFEFPVCSVKSMWYRWHLGQQSSEIAPYCHLKGLYREDISSDKRYLVDKAHRVMTDLLSIANDAQYGINLNDSVINVVNCGVIFDAAYTIMVTKLYPDRVNQQNFRSHDLMYTTIHKQITSKKVVF